MTFRHFQIYIAVCDKLNMTAAANELYMSQPAVSQAIAEMEAHYQVRLFERLSKKLYLTRGGEKLLGYARHIVRMVRDAEGEMRSWSETGLLRIGVSVTIGAWVLPKLVSGFKQKAPGVVIEVVEDNTSNIERWMMHDKLDLGLVEGELTLPDLSSAPFAEDRLVIVCGKGHRFSGRERVRPEELEQEDFIVREAGSGTRNTFERAMAEHGLTWKATWTCNNADTIKMAVAEGLGVAVLSQRAVVREVESGLLQAIELEGMAFKRTFKLAYHKNKYLTDTMTQFIQFCFEQFRVEAGT